MSTLRKVKKGDILDPVLTFCLSDRQENRVKDYIRKNRRIQILDVEKPGKVHTSRISGAISEKKKTWWVQFSCIDSEGKRIGKVGYASDHDLRIHFGCFVSETESSRREYDLLGE